MTEYELLTEALAKSPGERSAFLDEACAGDAELRGRVEQLLIGQSEPPPQSVGEDFDATLPISTEPAKTPDTPISSHSGESDLDATLPQGSASPASAPVSIVMKSAESNLSTMGADPDASVPFIFGQRIAQGGMGAIIEADDCKFGRKIAVKVMLSEGGLNTEQKLRFVQEAAVLGKLEHPNIVPVHDLGRDSGGDLYYSMKLVKGRTLQDIIDDLRKEDPEALKHYTLDRLLTIFRKICDALAFAHSENIIHRDLKPENIMVGEFGEVLVMDWGLSKILGSIEEISSGAALNPQADASASVSATLEGSVMGTPQYMSPEQAAGEITKMDVQSDIYSLGGILYAILTLRPPVEGSNVYEVLEKVQAGDVAPITSQTTRQAVKATTGEREVLQAKKIRPLPHLESGRVPPALSAVAMKALALRRKDRYNHVNELSREIEKWQSGFATSAEQAGLGTQVKLLIKRNKGVFTTAFAAWLLITALAVGFVLNLKSKEKRAREAEAVAVAEKETAREALARSSLSLADAALREGNGRTMESALADVPENLRDSTWHYLKNQSDTTIAKIDLGIQIRGFQIRGIAAHSRLPHVFALADTGGKITLLNVRTGVRLLEFGSSLARSHMPVFLSFSPNGERLAIGAQQRNSAVSIHSARDGKRILNLSTNSLTLGLEFSNDGKSLLQSEGVPNLVRLWDAETGQLRWVHKVERNRASSIAFSADGRDVFAKTNPDGIYRLSGNDGSVAWKEMQPRGQGLAVDPAGDLVISSFGPESALGFDPANGEERFRFPISSTESHFAYTATGDRFCIVDRLADGRQSIQIRDAKTGMLTQELLGGFGVPRGIALHPISGELAVGGSELFVWGLASAPDWTLPGSRGASVAFGESDDEIILSGLYMPSGLQKLEEDRISPLWEPSFRILNGASVAQNGLFAVIGDSFSLIRFLQRNGSEFEELSTFKLSNSDAIETISLSPSGSRLAAVSKNFRNVEVFNTSSDSDPAQPDQTGLVEVINIDWIDGRLLLGLTVAKSNRGSPDSEERIVIWDVPTGKVIESTTHPTAINVLEISPDRERFAEAGVDKMVRIRDAKSLAVLQEFRAHDDEITSMAWHPSEPILATGSPDLAIRLWNLETMEQIYELRAPFSTPHTLAFSPGGSRIAVTTNNFITRIWNLPSSDDLASGSILHARMGESMDESAWFSDPAGVRYQPLKIDAEGWTDLLSGLTPEIVDETGQGWKLEEGILRSPNQRFATQSLPGNYFNTSYRLRVTVRQENRLPIFHLVLPVGDRMTGFELDGDPRGGFFSSLLMVDGQYGRDVPGAIAGRQVTDSELHQLEVTVRLDGKTATINTTLDSNPFFEWIGPIASLSQADNWKEATPGSIAIGAARKDWEVSEVKMKRIEEED